MAALGDVRDIIRGAIASLFGFGGRLIARTALMVFAARAYGIEALGLLGLVAAITEIAAGVGVLGLKRGLLDLLSYDEEHGRAPESRVLEALAVGLTLSVTLAAIVSALWGWLRPGFVSVAPIILITVPLIVFAEIALTAIKFKRVIGWDVATRGVAEPWGFLVLAILLFQIGDKEMGLLWSYAGSFAISALFAGIGLTRIYGIAKFAAARPLLSNMLAIPKSSTPVGIVDLGFLALRRADLLVLSAFVSAEAVGLYYAVQQLATIPQRVYSLFEPMMSPVIARLHNQMNAKKIESNLIGVCRWVLIIQLAITLPMAIFGDYLLFSIFGATFAIGAGVLAIVLLAEIVDGTFMAVETPLIFAKPKIPPVLIVGAILIEVISIAVLAPKFGVYGAGLGFLVAIFSLTIGRLVMLKKHLDIGVLNTGYIFPIILAVVVSLALAATRRWIGPDEWRLFTALFFVDVVAYLALVRTFALTPTDRIVFRAIFQKRKTSTR